MKNFTLFSLFFLATLGSQKFYAQQSVPKSLAAYLYSCIEQSPSSIPAAIDAQKKAIIFDLDGVLCTTNDLQAFYEIGMTIILQYIMQYGKPSAKKLFQALEHAPAVTTDDAYNDGMRMPQIMVDWQTNAQELREIQDVMVQHISDLPLSITEKNLHINTVLMMTKSSKYIATKQTIPAGIELVRMLKKQGYKLYILSNWDAPSFNLFQERFPELFMHEGQKLFDGIMISGKMKMLKPNKEIFEACLKKFNIKKSDAIFIDDTIENIRSAENCGIRSIHCKNRDIATVKKELIAIIKS